LSWEKEQVLVLVKAAPNWSTKYKEYEICVAGVSEDKSWRRLYPFPEDVMLEKNVRIWDLIAVETAKPSDDPRPESRKIRAESIQRIGYVDDRKERRNFLEEITEPSLDIPMKERRTMALVRPRIEAFSIRKKTAEIVQLTLNGQTFRRNPYGDIGLYYKWKCPKTCQFCKETPHHMECFDWGTNVLYRRYPDEKEAKTKTKDMCYYRMKYEFDTWFALGTHSRRPWRRWMVVGLLWMKKEAEVKTNQVLKRREVAS